MSDDEYASEEEYGIPLNAPARSHRSTNFDEADEAEEDNDNERKQKADAQERAQARKESEKSFQNIMKFISEPPTVVLKHSKRGVAFWCGRSIDGKDINFRGVTGFLDQFIFPTPSAMDDENADVRSISVGVDYDAEAAQSALPDCRPCTQPPNNDPSGEFVPEGCMTRGRKHGILVHQQTQDLCVKYMNGKCPINAGQMNTDKYDACALALVDFFRNLNYIHLMNEIVVSHGQGQPTDLDMATAVDMLFYVAGDIQETHAVELKTCSVPIDKPYHAGAKLRFPLMDLDDTPYNRHSAQVMITIMLLEMHMGQDPHVWRGFTHFWLVYVNPLTKKVTRIGPAQWIYDQNVRANMYGFMLSMQQGVKLRDTKIHQYLSRTSESSCSSAPVSNRSSTSSSSSSSSSSRTHRTTSTKKITHKKPSQSSVFGATKSPALKRRCASNSGTEKASLSCVDQSSSESDGSDEEMEDDY